MKLKAIAQLFTARDLRNVILGSFVVIGGLALSGLTLYAHQNGDIRLATIAAAASLVFVVLILIFVVPPLARNAGREASQMNLPFEFTTGGAIIFILLVIVGFSAWNTGNNLLFLILAFLVSAVVVGFFAGGICLKKLDVTMRFPESIFAGESTPILVGLKNRKRFFPAYSVVVEVRGRERDRSIAAEELESLFPKWIAKRLGQSPLVRRTLCHFVAIAANSSAESKTEHVFANRGRLMIKDFEISTKFPFGFFRHRRRLPAREADLIVFPKLISIAPLIENIPLDLGRFSTSKRGLGQNLLSLRDYQPQDDLRHIDWKATARTRHLIVREFAAEDERRITVILDINMPAEPAKLLNLREKLEAEQNGRSVIASERFESGISLAASMISSFADEKAEIRLVLGPDVGELGIGRGHIQDCLKRLALAQPVFSPMEQDLDLERILNETDDSDICLVTATGTSKLSPDLLGKLKIVKF